MCVKWSKGAVKHKVFIAVATFFSPNDCYWDSFYNRTSQKDVSISTLNLSFTQSLLLLQYNPTGIVSQTNVFHMSITPARCVATNFLLLVLKQ